VTRPIDELLATPRGPAAVPEPPRPPLAFTVIVRTQGRRPGSLREALDAIAAQSHPPARLVLVVHGDEATTDRVRAAVGPHADRPGVTVVNAEGGGRSRPLNVGLDHATGDYVCFLDDDDLVTPDWIAAFARGAADAPGTVVRAVAESQRWTTDGAEEPVRPSGPLERPFPATFDLLSHLSANHTPICSIAVPLAGLDAFAIRFAEELPVFEDWDLLMRIAMLVGVTSVPEATSLYRRLDQGNADTVETAAVWEASHAAVIARLAARPVLLPAGDATRLARTHFVPGAGSRWEDDHAAARAEVDALTRSPWRWGRAFAGRARTALRHRLPGRRP
jgi:glycosyltransferase involved in cell wall biosynthesis